MATRFRRSCYCLCVIALLLECILLIYVYQGTNEHFRIISNAFSSKIQVVYKDLSHCPPRPNYLPGYSAHCWIECHDSKTCEEPPSTRDVEQNRSSMYCFSNIQTVAMRKCGTTDFNKWLSVQIRTQEEYLAFPNQCPTDAVKSHEVELPKGSKREKGNFFNGGPGHLVSSEIVKMNSSHLVLVSSMQFLGYMATPESRFYGQLRNPADRAVSNLFHWHKVGVMFSDTLLEDIDAPFIDRIFREGLDELMRCIAQLGDVACAFLHNGREGTVHELLTHGMYVLYIEEAFKFIPPQQFLFKTTAEYSAYSPKVIKEIVEFFGLPYRDKKDLPIRNIGEKNPVWSSTLQLLDAFYAPYNVRLAKLLGDEKWLFPADRGDSS